VGSWRSFIGSLIAVQVAVAIAITLYATGPAWTLSMTSCTSSSSSSILRPRKGKDCTTVVRRTNAWERLKGALRGSP
jgi:hypothetical protein